MDGARGHLCIFFGYAIGVGATSAMLKAAQQRRAEAMRVVIGCLEHSEDIEPAALLNGMHLNPLSNSGSLDVEVLLALAPQLVLVDELAHTNPPGSRHPRRSQDVEELLAAGIDVYTTLHVQHLESVKDVVSQITHLRETNTIPDRILDEADEVMLVDLPPDELLRRWHEGKVHLPQPSAVPEEDFFRTGNLAALRELMLRRAADWVNRQMRSYMQTRSIPGPWPTKERLLVAISSHPLNERLVRAGRRLADDLKAEWVVLYVVTPDRLRYSPSHSMRVTRALELAEALGAQVVTLQSQSIPEAIIEFAQKNNITKIIVGKPVRPRWVELLRGSLVDDLARASGSIDIYIISDNSGPLRRQNEPTAKEIQRWPLYLASLAIVAGTTLIGLPIHRYIEITNLAMLYLAAVVVAAFYLGRGPAMLASFLSIVAFDYFFVKPQFSFEVADTQYIITFLGLLVVGLVISGLASLLRDQVRASQRSEAQTTALYTLTRALSEAIRLEDVLQTIIWHISQNFSRETIILLPEGHTLQPRNASEGLQLSDEERSAAAWCFAHAREAGRSTDTMPTLRTRFVPLKTAHGMIGVLGVRPPEAEMNRLSLEQRQLLESFAGQAAISIERAQLAEQASKAQLLAATERLQTALLNTISHDLRTPLASVTGVLSSLLESEQAEGSPTELDHTTRLELLETALDESARLNRLVGNLLDMTRLEAGALKLQRNKAEVQDLVGAVLRRMGQRLADHPIQVNIPTNLPMPAMDFVLMVQVLTNLLENAAKYAPPGSAIEISARETEDAVWVSVADRGPGIPEADLERIFDKFYRATRSNAVSGTGLGLSICKGIVEAHEGRIWAANRPEGGALLTFALPISNPPGAAHD